MLPAELSSPFPDNTELTWSVLIEANHCMDRDSLYKGTVTVKSYNILTPTFLSMISNVRGEWIKA